jgi:F-type H+-transporting ATPase subunit a
LINRFAEAEPAVHITPGQLGTFHGFVITNSMLYGAICSVLIVITMLYIAKRMTLRPKGGLTQMIEFGTDFITNLLESSLGSRTKAVMYAPYFVAIFFFILFSNWLGLLPIVGESFRGSHDTPLFRPFTADLNGTLAAGTVTMIMVQYFAIKESGPVKHLKHYFNGSLKNPVTLLLGIFEMFSELTRIASLALRLFLNVTIGEIIISVFAFLGGRFAAPITALPFTILELLVGALQAYIFVMLSIMYLAVAVKHGEHDDHENPDDHLTVDEVVRLEVGGNSTN